MHDDGRIVLADLRNRFDEPCGQVELAGRPVAGQILRALLNGAVAPNDARACNAYERRELKSLAFRLGDQIFEHLDEALHALSRVVSSSA